MKRWGMLWITMVMLGGIGTLLGGCSKEEEKNIEAIEHVVSNIFNCPDEKLIELSNQLVDDMQNPDLEIDSFEEHGMFIRFKEIYGPYFTETAYESFLSQTIPFRYHGDAHVLGVVTNVTKFEAAKNKESEDNNYEFAFDLEYGPEDGEKETVEIKGAAQFGDEEGKISFLRFYELLPLQMLIEGQGE